MGERLGRPAELIVAADYRRCAADVDHVCFVCSVPYLLLSASGDIAMEPLVAPVLAGRRYGDRPIYFSDVIVRADGPFQRLGDLAGSRWAYNEPFSHSGFLVVLHHLVAIGAPPGFLGEWVEAGFHDEALHRVLDGDADWAAIDSQVLSIWQRQVPALRRRLRVVATLGPSTIQPVVASTRRLGPAVLDQLRDVLLELHRDRAARPILAGAGIRRFVAIGDADYDDIRRMLAEVLASGILPEWWQARWEAEARRSAVRA